MDFDLYMNFFGNGIFAVFSGFMYLNVHTVDSPGSRHREKMLDGTRKIRIKGDVRVIEVRVIESLRYVEYYLRCLICDDFDVNILNLYDSKLCCQSDNDQID